MDNEKKKYRFSVIDAIVIIAVVAVIAFCASKMFSVLKSDPLSANDTYRVKLEMKIMREGFSDNFKPGDLIYDRIMNNYCGKIIEVSESPSTKTTVSSEDGTVKVVSVPEKCDITFILEIESDSPVAVGQLITFKNSRAVASGYALETEKLGGND